MPRLTVEEYQQAFDVVRKWADTEIISLRHIETYFTGETCKRGKDIHLTVTALYTRDQRFSGWEIQIFSKLPEEGSYQNCMTIRHTDINAVTAMASHYINEIV